MSAMSLVPPLEYLVDRPLTEGARRETVVLVHGFPDSPAMWEQTAQYLTGRGHRVVRVTLPGFETDPQSVDETTFDVTLKRLHATLVHADALGTTLVGHDWGAILLYMLIRRTPDVASRFVALEIGAAPRSPPLTLFVHTYHALLRLLYWVGDRGGDCGMRWAGALLPRPSYAGAPTPTARHGWLYREAWRESGQHGVWHQYFRNRLATWTPPPELPFLFLYGRDGVPWLRFHTEAWCQAITAYNEASDYEGLPGRHWFFLDHPGPFHRALGTFFSTTASEVDTSSVL